ncbi:rRNA methyltransferase 3, mitochondrial [Atheta coriaria]|uniref:rRNA methyltransferase 3, mitochondrial n=1 Tax=Dalotia coriaria TaxID=877792 RepID=UPI0031F4244A
MNFISKLLTVSQTARSVVIINYRNYPRWTSRNPLKVVSSEELDEDHENKQSTSKQVEKPIEEAMKIKWRFQAEAAAKSQEQDVEVIEREVKIKEKKQKVTPKQKVNTTDMMETTFNDKGQLIYTKMKNNDPRVGQLLTTVKTKKSMTKRNLVLLEGKRLIRDALISGCTLKYLLFTRKVEVEYLKPNLPKCGAQMYKMPYKEMQMWSDLTTTPGIMGLFRTPSPENYISTDPLPITIFCDNIREPGNLGAIMRVAASAGCQKVLLSLGCVNIWDSKVIRSSAGSHFRAQIVTKKTIEDLRQELTAGNKILYIADNHMINTEDSKQENEDLEKLINAIPIIPYYSVNVKEANKEGKEIVLVIGGETHGIQADVYKLAQEFHGVRLNIPMSNGVESLNTGTALGIITFEFYRQFKTTSSLN